MLCYPAERLIAVLRGNSALQYLDSSNRDERPEVDTFNVNMRRIVIVRVHPDHETAKAV